MKIAYCDVFIVAVVVPVLVGTSEAFLAPPQFHPFPTTCAKLSGAATLLFSTKNDSTDEASSPTTDQDIYYTQEPQTLNEKLDWIAHRLKLQCYDADSGVYGMESKDRAYGIETVRVALPVEPSLGLELIEVAHGNDGRGLVLVSGVLGHARDEIQVGDTIVGVFAGNEFKESTTALDYDTTVSTIQQAKEFAMRRDLDTMDLELNRLVKRATVRVLIEQDWRDDHADVPEQIEIEALAGDNLRLLLMHHHQKVYDPRTVRLDTLGTGDCGGEGICGTCLVEVLEGAQHLNSMTPKETEVTTGRPPLWRASCQTVIGADNEDGSTLRIRLHPQSVLEDQLLHPGQRNTKLTP